MENARWDRDEDLIIIDNRGYLLYSGQSLSGSRVDLGNTGHKIGKFALHTQLHLGAI